RRPWDEPGLTGLAVEAPPFLRLVVTGDGLGEVQPAAEILGHLDLPGGVSAVADVLRGHGPDCPGVLILRSEFRLRRRLPQGVLDGDRVVAEETGDGELVGHSRARCRGPVRDL